MKILKLPGIKQIYNIFLNIKDEIDIKRCEDNCINECETKDMKFVWGLQSYDDLSKSNTANLYTMNDIDLIYLKDEKKYVLGIETAYLFDNKSGEYKYVKYLLNKFTEFMGQNNYDTSKELDVFLFNKMTFELINDLDGNREVEKNIRDKEYGIFTDKESKKICRALILEGNPSTEFLIDSPSVKKLVRTR